MKTEKEIMKMLVECEIDLCTVLDALIQLNGFVGVGLISLANNVADYINQHEGYVPSKEQNDGT